MKVFVSGGCKNGKSSYAQKIAKNMQIENTNLYYLATMIPKDSEDLDRILHHKKEREGMGFQTTEIPKNIQTILEECNTSGSFLLDSITALLTNEMFLDNGIVEPSAYKKVSIQLVNVLKSLNNIVLVSDYIYSDAFQYDPLTEQYRQGLAYVDKAVVEHCNIVLEVCYGNLIIHKGKDLIYRTSWFLDLIGRLY